LEIIGNHTTKLAGKDGKREKRKGIFIIFILLVSPRTRPLLCLTRDCPQVKLIERNKLIERKQTAKPLCLCGGKGERLIHLFGKFRDVDNISNTLLKIVYSTSELHYSTIKKILA
jgi:hypothetical protein